MLLLPRRPALGLAALVALASPALAAPRPWVEVRTPHFIVVSDAGESNARDVGWSFEQARTAYATLWRGATAKGGKPYVVFAARNEATLRSLGPEYWEKGGGPGIVSFQVEGRDRHYVAIRTDVETGDDVRMSPYFTPYRAYVGSVLGSMIGRPLPAWLYRGMVEVYGNTRVRKQDVLVARPVPWHVRTLREKGILRLPEIFAVERGAREVMDEKFNATCWAFVHYLSFGEKGALGARLNAVINLWAQGRSHEVALAEGLGDLDALEKGLRTYVSEPTMPYRTVSVDATVRRERFVSRALSEAEAAAAQAALHVAMGRPDEARARVAEAKEADAAAPTVLDAEALLAEAGDDAAALTAYRRAAEAGSTSYFTHFRLAQLLHRGASGDKQQAFTRIAAALDRVIELNPEYAHAHSYLAEVKVFLGDSEAAATMARTAIALDPNEPYHHLALAGVLLDRGKHQEAFASAQRAAALGDEGERRQAEEVVARVRAALASTSGAGVSTAAAGSSASPSSGRVVSLEGSPAAPDGTRSFECSTAAPEACAQVAFILEVACKGGKGGDCASLASLYSLGLGVPKDAEKAQQLRARARELLDAACRKGDAEACTNLRALPH